MRHTLKAVFNDRDIAQQALDTLLASGYLSDDAVLTTVLGNRRSNGAGMHAVPRRGEQRHKSTTRLLDFLFSHEKSDLMTKTPSRCPPDSHILTLATDSEPEAKRASLLISGFVRTDGEGGGPSVPNEEPSISHISYRRRVTLGALQFYVRKASHRFSDRNTEETSRTGAVVLKPTPSAGQWPDLPLVESDKLSTSAGPPVDDEDAREARRFGHDMHHSDRYCNRSWSEAGADLKVLWKIRNPGRGKWESAESAIQFGWNSTSLGLDDSCSREHLKTSYSRSPEDNNPGAERERVASETENKSIAAWKQQHPGELPAWERFMDALRYGWDRIVLSTDTDESDYRIHHANHYPGTDYNDLAPVYRYGNNVRRRTAFHNRSWEEIESELRVEWERGYREGKPFTWDEMKPALYRGWTHVEC